jgi:predicted nucleic acid-binding Zn ribbon protein
MLFGRLLEEWATVVGADVAARSTPVGLRAGVLSIRADGAAWATELTLLGRSIVEKVDSYLGGGVVREVRVSAGAPLR